jgi:hypothetical protein
VFSNNLATANLPTGVATPATAVDGVLYTTVGGSLNRIAQSGTTVGAALPGVSYANATSTSSTSAFLAVPNQAINNAGTVLYDAKFLAGTGGITLNTNDQALMAWRSGGSQVLFQSGVSQVPGASAGTTFASLFPSVGIVNRVLNNAEHVSFVGTMNAGGTTDLGPITSSNNLGLFFSDITGSLPSQLIAQGGMTAPGTGSTFGNAGFNGVIMNNNDLMVFSNVLADARTGYFAWSPDMGLVNLFNSGTTSLLGPNYPLGSISYSGVSNGNGGVLSLNDNGLFTFFANAPANGAFPVNNVLMVMQIPAPGAAGALALLGLVAARRRRA